MTLEKDIEKLKTTAKSSGDKIKQCGIFLSIYTHNYEENPLCALQLGIAIMLDKPIGILAYEGMRIPQNLKRVAFAIEYAKESDSKSLEEAIYRLVQKMTIIGRDCGPENCL